jgi:hypothetical protein
MQYHILKENPANSGTYVETGESVDEGAEHAAELCAVRTAETGVKHAMLPHDKVRRGGLIVPPPFVADVPPVEKAE